MNDQSAQKTNLSGFDARPLRQQIADTIRSAILSGELRPGASLVEADIATQLGVSRAPVREALQLLANSNLVETIPYRGTSVRKLTRSDVDEVYSLRIVLETFALRRTMAHSAAHLERKLRSICNAMEKYAAKGDWPRVSDEDDKFHKTLIELAQHDLLLTVWRSLNMRVRQIMALRNRQNDDSMAIFYNHLPIVDAIAADDVETAVKRLEQHIATAADLVTDSEKDTLSRAEEGHVPTLT